MMRVLVVAVVCMAFFCATGGFAAAPPREAEVVTARVAEALDALEESGDFEAAEASLQDLFDSLIAHAADNQTDAFAEAAFALRLVRLVSHAEEASRLPLLTFLRAKPGFAQALAFAARPGEEDAAEVCAMADRLRTERPERVEQYPTLAAAIAIVHDKPLKRNFNENRAEAPDPIALFDFYIANEKRMLFGLRDVPAELLAYVVDVTGTIEDLQWAAARYAGHQAVGALFFDIQYDYDHYRTGQPKKVTLAGWNLPNILQYGGVCSDQAYFATTVGKAIGVPTAYTIGKNADVGHAWVGFLQGQGRRTGWNFEAGRYGAYLGLKGVILDPQTRTGVDDSTVSLLAEFAVSRPHDRMLAAAFSDAAARLGGLRAAGGDPQSFAPPALVETAQSRRGRLLRQPTVEAQLDLVESAVRAAPGYARAWFMLADLASEGVLSLDVKKKWSSSLDRLCGQRYPHFALSILKPMVETVEDVEEQNELWNAAFRSFSGRMDLAAEIRMAQAEMWAEAGEVNKAGQCYMDVIERFANAGPFVITALRQAEELLVNSGRENRILELYASTWNRIQRPEDMAGMFAVQSNWYQVGMLYAKKLDDAGLSQQAAQVRSALGAR